MPSLRSGSLVVYASGWQVLRVDPILLESRAQLERKHAQYIGRQMVLPPNVTALWRCIGECFLLGHFKPDSPVKDEKRKERQNERKRHSRANTRAAAEAENPGGKKRRKMGKTASRAEVAEASRPAHQIKKKIKDETRKPSGRKQKKPVRPAKYVNWLTPFSWSAITKAQRKVGWGYTDIIRELKRGNFASATRTRLRSLAL
ncbi:hypothetical protein B0H14DRAFT_2634753 [Mycena olivaceomarginata]|nr:hypothetical protein B0H14DRAFT_2634753 [Mycena olivaceomarginata]